MKELGRLDTVREGMNKNSIQILGVTKANGNNCGDLASNTSHKVIFTGKENGYSHGVAVILSKETAKTL